MNTETPLPWAPPDNITVLEWGDREGWLLARGRDVTASQVGALWGEHPYTSLLELHHQKRGSLRHEPRSPENAAMRRGRIFEAAAVDLLREDHPDWTIFWSANARTYFRDPVARLGATPDVLAIHPTLGRGIVQIKTTGSRQYRKEWTNDAGEPEAPTWIMLQALLEQNLTGASWAAVAPLVVDEWFSVEMPLIEVPQVDGLFETMKARTAAFWQGVEENIEPAADYARDGSLIERLHKTAGDDELDWTQDERAHDLLAAREEALAQRREANAALEQIDAEIKHRLADAAVAHIGRGRVIRWQNERRAGRMLPPTNGRVLRLPSQPRRTANA